jgi:hypothetical protein
VVAGIPKAPDGAHERSERGMGEPKSPFVPNVPRAKALNPPRKNSRRFNMVIFLFRDFIAFCFYRKHNILEKSAAPCLTQAAPIVSVRFQPFYAEEICPSWNASVRRTV